MLYSSDFMQFCSGQQQKEEFIAHINKINKNQGLTKEEEEANIPEPHEMVVKAKKLAIGPWYKCSKGRHLSPKVIIYILEACFNNFNNALMKLSLSVK